MTDIGTNPFDALDFTLDDALAADAQLITRSPRDPRICICGHPAGRHSDLYVMSCKPSAMSCPCKGLRVVLESDDVRPFLRKTEGAGPLHALGRGMAAAMKKGIKFWWTVPIMCDRCKTEGPVSPVAVSQRGISMSEATGYDALLCASCRTEV